MDSKSKLTVSETLLNSPNVSAWQSENIWHPIVNTLWIDPHNAITSTVNDVSKSIGTGEVLSDWKPLNIPKAEPGSKEWLVQNIAGGAAMVIPYGLAAVASRGVLRTAGAKWAAEGTTAAYVLNSRATATIVGGTVYDFFKKPHEHETRVGNALGAAIGFSIFEGGNYLAKGRHGLTQVTIRGLTGSIGAVSQHSVSRLTAGYVPERKDLWNAALTGATMNNLMPAFTDKVSDMVNGVSVARGKGMPVDDFVRTQGAKDSPELNKLVAENTWTRVQPGEKPPQVDHSGRLIDVPAKGGEPLPKLAHELAHKSRNAQAEPLFEQSASLLAEGKTTEARAKYLQARTQQELAALAAEQQVARELGKPVSQEAFDPARSRTPEGKTYQEVWLAEFEKFRESKGSFRPEVDFRPRTSFADVDWNHISRNLDKLGPEQRSEVARNLQHAPEGTARSIFSALLRDADPSVRSEAVRNIGSLPANARAKAWYEVFGRPDPSMKAAALEVIGQLPATERYAAWCHARNHLRTISAESASGQPRAVQLVKAIEQLPNRDRYQAWESALNNRETAKPAADNLAVLPEGKRAIAWHMLQRQGKAGPDALMKQVPDLAAGDRVAAFDTLVRESKGMTGESTRAALASLPEGIRFQQWRKLLAAAEAGEQSPVFEALSAVSDPRIKSAAWQEAFTKCGKANSESAAKAIAGLPIESRATALLRVMAEAPNNELKGALLTIAPSDVVQVQRGITKMPDSELRAQLAQSLPVYKLGALPVAQRIDTLKNIFDHAQQHPDVFAAPALRNWWKLLPEKAKTDPTAHVQENVVRDALASRLNEQQLATIIFAEDPTLAQRMASTHPDAVRAIARNFTLPQAEGSSLQLRLTAEKFLQTQSLVEATKAALSSDSATIDAPVADLLAGLSKSVDRPQLIDTLQNLSRQIQDPTTPQTKTNLAIDIAVALRSKDPALFHEHVGKQLEATMNDQTVHPQKRFEIASEVARLSREGRLPEMSLRLPSSRTEVSATLSEAEQLALRGDIENAFADPARLKSFMEGGKLAEVFPEIFQKNPAVAERLAALANQMQSSAEFAKLAPADRVNLMWAALIHEGAGAKLPAGPHLSWSTAADAYGLLDALGYPPERVQRIATLISRHTELAPVDGNPVLTDPARARDLALVYRHPEALRQIGIYNKAKLVLEGQRPAEIDARIGQINAAIELAGLQQRMPAVPILLSQLPRGFGVETLAGDWRVLGHTSPYITDAFLKQLGLIQSPHHAMSTSLLTPRHLHLYHPEAKLVALVTAPTENVVSAGTRSFTGTNVDWARVLRDSASLAEQSEPVVREVNAALARLADTTAGAPRNIVELNRALAQVSNLSELPASSPYLKAVEAVYSALVTEGGVPLAGHNEAKVVNPTLTGIGVIRGGQPVALQGVSHPAVLSAMLGGKEPPSWLQVDTTGNTIVIPETVWRPLMKMGRPIVSLEGAK